MKINQLKNPDIIEINGEKYQVIENTSTHYDIGKKELEMTIYLVKVGQTHLEPKYKLTYLREKPEDIKFYEDDKEQKIEKITLN